MKFEITKPEKHIKKWGYELWIVNDSFCGKILHFDKKGSKFSMHMHQHKSECQMCYVGKFLLKYIDPHNAAVLEREINVGDIINIPQCQCHQLIALENDSEIFEVSSHHEDSDSWRVFPGDSQSNI